MLPDVYILPDFYIQLDVYIYWMLTSAGPEALNSGKDFNARHEQTTLETALKDLEKARKRAKTELLQTQHNLTRRQERASILAATGGSPGMYEHKKTGQLLPILVGTTMQDPSGSGMEVPILGVEKDKSTGNMTPLGGTHEDPEGQGLVAIKLGSKAVDSISGEMSPISGIRRDPTTGSVVPVTLSSSTGHKNKKAPIGKLLSFSNFSRR